MAVYRNCLPTKVCIQRSVNHKQLESNPLCSAILFYLPDNFQKRLHTCLLFSCKYDPPCFSSVYKVANACILLVSNENTIKWKHATVRNVASGSRIYTPAGIYDFIRDSRKAIKEHRRMFQGWPFYEYMNIRSTVTNYKYGWCRYRLNSVQSWESEVWRYQESRTALPPGTCT